MTGHRAAGRRQSSDMVRMQVNAYTLSLFVAALISGGLSWYAWRRRSVEGGAEIAVLMLSVTLWALFQCFEGAAATRVAKMFWGTMGYLGSQTTPVLFLVFAVKYTHHEEWLNWKRIALMFVLPLASVLLAATSGLQHYLWRSVTITTTFAGKTGIYSHGPWYWIESAYGYALVVAGLFLLVRAVFRHPGLYSWQARTLIVATLVPLAWHLVYSFVPHALQGLDMTPIVFTFTGMLVALALFRFRLLDLRPVASDVLYESIGDAMFALDNLDRVVDVNPAACEVIGMQAGEAVGKGIPEAFAAVPALGERVRSISAGETAEFEAAAEGRRVYYSVSAWPLVDRRKRAIGRLVTMHDITGQREAQEELERINTDLDVYAHTVSHDLKSPLAALQLASESLERFITLPESPERNENIGKLANIIGKNTRKSAALVNSLLALAEAGQRPTDVHDVDLDAIVERVIEERAGEIDAKGIRVEHSALGTIRADEVHMYQLFANLIANSIVHNVSEKPAITVERMDAPPGSHVFRVRDNGEGIAPEDLGRIFEPFYKHGTAGAGIGLSTVSRIVQVYDGEIRAYNDNGACFEVTLKDYPG